MSTPPEVLAAIATLTEYRKKINKQFCKRSHTCICCKQEVITALGNYHNDSDPLKQENRWWNNGILAQISGGYGSVHDTDSFYMAICDKCITELEESGVITNLRGIRNMLEDYLDDVPMQEIFPKQ